MNVSCPACAARYTADDEKLRGKTARMRCKACNAVWLVSGPSVEPATPSAAETNPVPNDSKRAAVVKTGADREKRDLFAAREPEEGSIKQTLLPPPSLRSGVGARNENSVLFRVDQLAACRVKTSAPTRAPAMDTSNASLGASVGLGGGGDDEGVIDLKALSSAPPPKIGLSVAPLFSEPPAVSLDVNAIGAHRAAKPARNFRLIGGIAAAAAVILLAGFGVSLAFKGEEPVKHAAVIATPPPPPAETAAPNVEPAPPPVAAAADAKDTKDPTDAKESRSKKGKGGKGRAAKNAATSKPTAAPAAKPAPKPANPCGCNGDFNCILACTAKNGK
jgi:predicted Zn finger-like uncharacterized protein